MKKLTLNLLKSFFLLFFFFSCSSDNYKIIITPEKDPDLFDITNIVSPYENEDYPHTELKKIIDKDFLLLFYINGDTPYNDYLFYQMAQIGKGLSSIMRFDGITPKKNYSKITAVGLWDGSDKDNEYTPKYYHKYSFPLEFKIPSQKYTAEIAQSIENFAEDYSKIIMESDDNWLGPINEVDMGDSKTLSNFLKWAIKKYNPENDKEIILCISGLAGGSFGDETGSYIAPDFNSRATCRDYSDESNYLSAKDIKTALSENGFSNTNKLPMIIIDSAFSSSIEDIYEYKDIIQCMIASPSNVPPASIDYNYLIRTLRKNTSLYNIGTETVNIYANRNYNTMFSASENMASLTFIDLINIDELAINVSMLADTILTRKNSQEIDRKYSIYDKLYDKSNCSGFLYYEELEKNQLTDTAMFYKAIYQHKIPNDDFFTGYFYQFDLPYLAYKIKKVSQNFGIRENYYYCDEILKNTNSMIISTWRNFNGNKYGLYNYLNKQQTKDEFCQFGITITGPAKEQYVEIYLQPYNFSDFSFRDFKYLEKSNWKDLLFSLFPEQFQENKFLIYEKYRN